MKISRNWLQTYFEQELPGTEELSDALTFHVFEIDGVERVGEDDILDVKVTANRGHDCLSYIGIAKELSAILQIPLKTDPLKEEPVLSPVTDRVSVSVGTPLCRRYIAGVLEGVKVAPSPQWLVERLAAMGQRSVNNVVDATNFVMFSLGQPLHAFDAAKLIEEQGYKLGVRAGKENECMIALDGREYTLDASMLVITDAHTDTAIGIAGVKGGMPAAITEATKTIIIESANFDSVAVRKAASTLKLRTDASARFEQGISPELAAYGMREVVNLIIDLAGGKTIGFTDAYAAPATLPAVSVQASKVTETLGATFGTKEIEEAFSRLGFMYTVEGEVYTVTPPFSRLDLAIPEDLIEEIGRITGYDHVPAEALPALSKAPQVNSNFYAAEQAREDLVAKGYSEVFTSVFSDNGERIISNKVDGVKPYLRTTLLPGLRDALEKNKHSKELLELKEVKLFEIGIVWKDGREDIMLGTVGEKEPAKEELLGGAQDVPPAYESLPISTTIRYTAFSKYPYIVRDIALWVPSATDPESVLADIRRVAGALAMHAYLFDRFEKGEKVSLAFRIIFQSFERTLTEGEAQTAMQAVGSELQSKGFEIR